MFLGYRFPFSLLFHVIALICVYFSTVISYVENITKETSHCLHVSLPSLGLFHFTIVAECFCPAEEGTNKM